MNPAIEQIVSFDEAARATVERAEKDAAKNMLAALEEQILGIERRDILPIVSDVIRADMEKSTKGFLKDMSLEVSQWDIAVDIILREGAPHEVILTEADNWAADLIVMDKLGKRGVSRILLGSGCRAGIEFTRLPVMLATA